jgi:type I restriction enzyme S subunit
MRNISQTKLRAIRLATPPPAEQSRIVAELQRRLSITEKSRHNLGTMRRRVVLLRRSLLHAAVTGQLVDQDPEDERAELLLKRIADERVTASAECRRSRTVSVSRPGAATMPAEEFE